MSRKRVTIDQNVSLDGYSVSSRGIVTITLYAGYVELPQTIRLMDLMGEYITLSSFALGEEPMLLGNDFRIKQITVDANCDQKIRLHGVQETIDVSSISKLPARGDEDSEFTVTYEAEIETFGENDVANDENSDIVADTSRDEWSEWDEEE